MLDRLYAALEKSSALQPMQGSVLRQLVGMVAGLVVMALLIVVLARQIQLDEITWQEWLQTYGVETIVVVGVILAIATALMLWLWGSMMAAISPSPAIRWRTHLGIYLTTALGKRLPGAFWHVASRTVLYNRHGVRKRTVLAVSGIEVLFMTASGALLALILFPTLFPSVSDNPLLLLGLVALAASLVVTLRARVLQCLSSGDERQAPHLPLGLRLQWLVACAIIWLLGGALVAFLANRLTPLLPTDVLPVVASWVLAALIGTITLVLPAGFGIADLTLTYFLSLTIPTAEAAFVALSVRLLAIAWDLLMALLSGATTLFSGRNNPYGLGQ